MQNKLFDNTEIAFKNKSLFDLLRACFIFKIISFPSLVSISKSILLLFLKIRLPIKFLIKHSIFKQFCGGENEDDCKVTIDNLMSSNIYSILDYSVEGLVSNESFDNTVSRTLNLIKLNTSNNFPFIVFKPTAIGEFKLYEKVSLNMKLSKKEVVEWASVINRYNIICDSALRNNVSVLIDAEESWIQPSVDKVFENLVIKYKEIKQKIVNPNADQT